MSPYQTVGKYIIPEEANRVAAQYRAAAAQIHQVWEQTRSVGDSLQGSWIGTAKEKFFLQYEPVRDELYRYADALEDMAREIASIQVWVEEQVWYDEAQGEGINGA
jgi:WXG100 family type VII secretion target